MMSRILNSVAEDKSYDMNKSFALYFSHVLHYFKISLSISRISCCHFCWRFCLFFKVTFELGIFSCCLFLMTIRTEPWSQWGWLEALQGLPGFFLFSLMPWVLASEDFPYWLYQFSSPFKKDVLMLFPFWVFLTRTVFQNRLLNWGKSELCALNICSVNMVFFRVWLFL